jgi:hypothetical protein
LETVLYQAIQTALQLLLFRLNILLWRAGVVRLARQTEGLGAVLVVC